MYRHIDGTIRIAAAEKITMGEVYAHIISFLLYRTYLESKDLCVIEYENYIHLFKDIFRSLKPLNDFRYIIADFSSPEYILKSYLSPFFRKIKGSIYYVPSILVNKTDEYIVNINKLLTRKFDSGSQPSEYKLMEELNMNVRDLLIAKKVSKRIAFIIAMKRLLYDIS